MIKVLVTFSKDWADEFQAEGFAVLEKNEWEKIAKNISECENYTWWFGTNQGWEDVNGKQFLTNYKVQEISDIEADVITCFLAPHNNFGVFPDDSIILEELEYDK